MRKYISGFKDVNPTLTIAVHMPRDLEFGIARAVQTCIDTISPPLIITRTKAEFDELTKQFISDTFSML
jgi:hypothetical protein